MLALHKATLGCGETASHGVNPYSAMGRNPTIPRTASPAPGHASPGRGITGDRPGLGSACRPACPLITPLWGDHSFTATRNAFP
jgi:hypothetical protein